MKELPELRSIEKLIFPYGKIGLCYEDDGNGEFNTNAITIQSQYKCQYESQLQYNYITITIQYKSQCKSQYNAITIQHTFC